MMWPLQNMTEPPSFGRTPAEGSEVPKQIVISSSQLIQPPSASLPHEVQQPCNTLLSAPPPDPYPATCPALFDRMPP